MAVCSFSRVVLLLFSCLLGYYAYNMYLLFNPAQCPAGNRNKCLLPAYSKEESLEVISRGNLIDSILHLMHIYMNIHIAAVGVCVYEAAGTEGQDGVAMERD